MYQLIYCSRTNGALNSDLLKELFSEIVSLALRSVIDLSIRVEQI